MLSNIALGTQVIPFDIERYNPEKFQVVDRSAISIAKKPDEVPALHLAHEMVKYHIMNSGSYSLSPFCLVIDSEVNTVTLPDGRSIPWAQLLDKPNTPFLDTPYTATFVRGVSRNGKKQAYRYTLEDGTQFDCTPEHRFETLLHGQKIDLPISEIAERKLPLLAPKKLPSTLPSTDAYNITTGPGGLTLEYPELAEGERLVHISGEEGRYAITSHGRVWSFNKLHAGGTGQVFPARWLKPSNSSTGGYLTVCLGSPNKQVKIHQLVAQHFINNPHFDPEIDHIDGDVTNNHVDNLRWCTREFNLAMREERKLANTGMYAGVYYHEARQQWCARVSPRGGSRIFIGWFSTALEAAQRYDQYVQSMGWHLAPYHVRLNFSEWQVPPQHTEIPVNEFTHSFARVVDVQDLGLREVADIAVFNHDHKYLLNGYRTHNSFNWNQHSQIYTIISIFKKFSNSIVLSSCRVDAIARDPGLAQLINQFGAQNLTVAVEGISGKICNFLQKSLMPEEFYVGMNTIIHQNFASVKMYYIYTGLEGEEDIEEFEGHLKRIDEIRRKAGKPTFEMRMSFTPLLSTLGTPLQYHGSKVSRSLKTGSYALFKIKHLCARYGFGIRLSSSIASSDFAQTVEFLDRRGQPLLEYLSLNGAFSFPKLNLLFYKDPEEITKEVHDHLVAANRTKIGGKYYRVKPIDRITVNKLYALVNAESLFPEHSIYSLIEQLRKLHGEATPEHILNAFPKRRRAHLEGTLVKVAEDEGDDYITSFENGKKAYHMMINVTVNDIAADIIKSWIPMFTNGVTFNDVTDDKDALYIFPSMHIKFHRNRHIGQDFKQYVANRAYIFDSYCFNDALSKCVNCGACDTIAEVKHVTTTPYKETGENSMHKLQAVQRDNEVFQKLLVEVRIKPGPYSAIQPRWLRFAITRAILKASDGELVEPNIQERFSHSRQFYRIHQDSFKSMLSGSFIAELSFNSLVNIDEAYLQRLQARVNQYVTEGWYVANISRKSKDFLLKNAMQYAMTTYRFDSRKVNGVDLDLLKKQIDVFFNSNAAISYKSQTQSGRDTTRVVVKDFDKSKILFASAGIGRNRYETVLKLMGKVEDNHPLIFLAGFLGATKDGKGKPKSYTALYGTEVSIDGFYQYSSTHSGSNLFDLLAEDGHDHEHSTECPKCGGVKLINIMTGLPFGEADYEQDPVLLSKYGKVCQTCFAEGTS